MKFISQKVIKGKKYFYLQYQGKSKNLGPILPKNIKEELLSFFFQLGERQYPELQKDIIRNFPYGDLKALEQCHYWYICLSEQELFSQEYHDFMTWFSLLFSFNSNRSEGSKVTQPEFEKFVLAPPRTPKTKTEREIFNSFRALRYAFSPEMKWTMKDIKRIHALLLEQIDPLIAGQWKNEQNVAPGNSMTSPVARVQKDMKALMIWLRAGFKKDVYPPLLALQFYLRFEVIHPFLDGNGRTGRILLNALLHHFKYMPVIFLTRNHQQHCDGIKKALEGRSAKLHKHFLEQAKKTFHKMREIIG